MKKQVIRAAATTVMGLSLMTGFAAADINTTGPNSDNKVRSSASSDYTATNRNDVDVRASNHQDADSGDAKVYGNTTGGNAASGDADNYNEVSASVGISNTGSVGGAGFYAHAPALGSISNTGNSSKNTIESHVSNNTTVRNTNEIEISSYNHQDADSGNATVSGNTTGGSATTGDAVNTSVSTFELSVSN